MDNLLFNTEKNTSSLIEKDILSVFKTNDVGRISLGMSPKEIAEVTSNHLINVIKEQFEVAKNNFQNTI